MTMKKSLVMFAVSTAWALAGCSAPLGSEPVGSVESRQTAGGSAPSPSPSPSPTTSTDSPPPLVPTATSASGCGVLGCATTGTLAAGEKAIEAYGQEATKNTSLDALSSAKAAAGALVAWEISTGKMVVLAGVGATGPITLVGGDGTSRDGNGSVAIGAGASWDPMSYTLTWGGALVGYYTVDLGSAETGASMPADAEAATAAFDAAFGEAARYGATLDKTRSIAWFGGTKVIAYYNVVETTVTGQDGSTYPAKVAMGIINDLGKIKAVQFSGLGAYRSNVK
jgi:hypothetical protein